MSAQPHREVEIKLGLRSEADRDLLLRALGGAIEVRRQRNRFFDGPGSELSRAEIALRVREELVERAEGAPEALTWITLKRGGSVIDATHIRKELQALLPLSLEEAEADPSALLSQDLAPIQYLRETLPHLDRLVNLGGFDNERKVVPIGIELGPGVRREVRAELDRVHFGGDRLEWELEIELEADPRGPEGGHAQIEAAVRRRLEELGINTISQPSSKFARFRRYRLGAS